MREEWWFSKSEEEQLSVVAVGMIFCGVMAFLLLMFMAKSYYGRYSPGCSTVWGFKINAKIAWVVQELPNVVLGIINIAFGRHECLSSSVNQIFLGLFMMHYINRTFIFPLLIRGGKPTPFNVFLLAFIFCMVNGYMQTRMLTSARVYDESWFLDPRFSIGLVVFFTGMYINMQADAILRTLRKPGETGYKIPKGGAFRFVSAANFWGEILEWTGYAIAQWNLTAAAFAFFTFCNLAPRGWHHHLWYKSQFPEYPRSRKAVIPFIW